MSGNIDGAYRNKRCLRCGWKILSFVGRDYRYCPMCRAQLVEYDIRVR